MRLSPERLGVIALGSVSLGLLVGSVALAFGVSSEGSIYRAQAELPESLFAVDVESEVAPVAEVLVAEVDPAPSASPEPTAPRAATKPTPKTTSPAGGQSRSAQLKMSLAFTSEVIGKGKGRKIRYTGTISNTGGAPISRFDFTSHVPGGTEWLQGSCDEGLRELQVSRDSGQPTRVCSDPTPDASGHDIHHAIDGELAPGAAVSLVFTVTIIDEAASSIVDHAHATADGLNVSSGDVVTELR